MEEGCRLQRLAVGGGARAISEATEDRLPQVIQDVEGESLPTSPLANPCFLAEMRRICPMFDRLDTTFCERDGGDPSLRADTAHDTNPGQSPLA